MVDALVAAGAPPGLAAQLIARAFQAGVEAAQFRGNSTGIPPDSAAEKRRAYDRLRKRNSTGIPPDSTGIPKRALVEELDIKKVSRKGSRIPPEWAPSETERKFATERGWSGGQIDDAAANFRDYWIAKPGAGGLKLDWSRTWQKWVRDSKIKPAGGPSSTAVPASLGEMDWRAVMANFKKFGLWSRHAPGSEPGTVACVVPAEILAEFGYAQRDGPAVELPRLKAV